ncbi:hypothetical protein C2S51_035242 [Perilla frutescens var. frutescens]|nr:hypothetical protein C2S51_035242 [Perilla frutescens var. frutescens]
MEVSFPSDTPAPQDFSSNSESVTTHNIPTDNSSGAFSMNDMKMCLNEFLSIEDIGKTNSDYSAKCDVVIEDECKDSGKSSYNLPESTSTVEGMLIGEKGREEDRTSEANGCEKSVDKCYSPPESLATPLKLASAMKGSREKQGIPQPVKLSVTWAPDVYDPIPSSVSHVPSSRNQQYRNSSKKYGKNKQKGGGKARGSKGKDRDKKQARKNGGNNTSSAAKFKAVHDDSVAHAGIIDFNVVGTDPFCGSSFLKNSVNNLHFPVAEATR